MKFTLSSDIRCNGHQFKKGDPVELLPTSGTSLLLKTEDNEFPVGPHVFNFLNEVESPGIDTLTDWFHEMICESPTGHLVESDGTGPDGFHSWFVYLGMI